MNGPTLYAALIEYGLGVVLPATITFIIGWIAYRSAWYAAWRNTK